MLATSAKRDAEAWSRMNEKQMDKGIYLDRSEAARTTLGEILLRYKREVIYYLDLSRFSGRLLSRYLSRLQ